MFYVFTGSVRERLRALSRSVICRQPKPPSREGWGPRPPAVAMSVSFSIMSGGNRVQGVTRAIFHQARAHAQSCGGFAITQAARGAGGHTGRSQGAGGHIFHRAGHLRRVVQVLQLGRCIAPSIHQPRARGRKAWRRPGKWLARPCAGAAGKAGALTHLE